MNRKIEYEILPVALPGLVTLFGSLVASAQSPAAFKELGDRLEVGQ